MSEQKEISGEYTLSKSKNRGIWVHPDDSLYNYIKKEYNKKRKYCSYLGYLSRNCEKPKID